MKFPKEKEHLMEALFNYASMSIIVVDASGSIVLVNPFALKKFGYTEKELVGRKAEQLIPRQVS